MKKANGLNGETENSTQIAAHKHKTPKTTWNMRAPNSPEGWSSLMRKCM